MSNLRSHKSVSLLDLKYLNEVLQLVEPYFGPKFNWNKDLIKYELENNKVYGFFEADELKAFLSFRDLNTTAEITCLATKREFQREGCMLELLNQVINANSHYSEFWLEVHIDNQSAIRLYEQFGFKNVGLRKNYYKDGQSALMYSYQVNKTN